MAKRENQDLESISATKAKVNFGDVLYQTSVNGKRYVVKRQGKPVAVVLSYNDYLHIMEEKKALIG